MREKENLLAFPKITKNKLALEILFIFKEFLRYNGETIQKNCKIMFISFEQPPIDVKFFESSSSHSGSFSFFPNDINKEHNKPITFSKTELENDEKKRFLKIIKTFKERFGLHKSQHKINSSKKNSESFNGDEEIESFEKKLKSIISICKKEEKDSIKFINNIWYELTSSENFLPSLKIKLENSINNQQSLVIYLREPIY